MEHITFGTEEIERKLSTMDDKDLDGLAFGAIQLDKDGNIKSYNAAEGALTGRDPDEVIGKNFFEEVAPCTNEKGFRDVFEKGVANDDLNTLLEWTFDHLMTPTKVQVHMKKAAVPGRYWVFVKRV
jgi:photoactive yellow protein